MSTFKRNYETVMSEIDSVLSYVNSKEVENFITLFEHIKKVNPTSKIVVAGAGRMGYAAKGFAMRLGHMGYNVWMLGDSTVPHIGEEDILVVASGSGNTQTIYDISKRAYDNGASICLITNNPDSRIGRLASRVIRLPNGSNKDSDERSSQQPMTTLNEQCLAILLDTIVLGIMNKTGETHDTMWNRHSNLE